MRLALIFQSLTIILAPLYILRGSFNLTFFDNLFPFIPLTFLEVMIFLTVIVTLFEFLKDKERVFKIRTKFDILILLFLLTAIISLKVTPDFLGGLGIFKAYFIEPILFFYCLTITSKKYGYTYIIYSLVGAGVWLSLLGVLQKLTGSFTLATHEIAQGRISGVYNSANSLALFLGPISVLALGQFVLSKKIAKKVLFFGLFVLFTLIMVWSRSRGGLLGELGAIAIFAYTVITLKFKFLKKIWYMVPLTCFLVIALFFYQIYQSYNFFPIEHGKPYTAGDTLQIRFFIWMGTVNLLKDNPIFGAGLNGFKTVYSNQYRLPEYQEQFQYPHNILLTIWSELGIYGLFIFLLILTSCFGLVIRKITTHSQPVFGAVLIGMLSYWIIHGMVDVPYFKNDLSLEFWVVVALFESWSNIKKESN